MVEVFSLRNRVGFLGRQRSPRGGSSFLAGSEGRVGRDQDGRGGHRALQGRGGLVEKGRLGEWKRGVTAGEFFKGKKRGAKARERGARRGVQKKRASESEREAWKKSACSRPSFPDSSPFSTLHAPALHHGSLHDTLTTCSYLDSGGGDGHSGTREASEFRWQTTRCHLLRNHFCSCFL